MLWPKNLRPSCRLAAGVCGAAALPGLTPSALSAPARSLCARPCAANCSSCCAATRRTAEIGWRWPCGRGQSGGSRSFRHDAKTAHGAGAKAIGCCSVPGWVRPAGLSHLFGLLSASPGEHGAAVGTLYDRAPLAALPSLVRGRARSCAGASAALVQPLADPFCTFPPPPERSPHDRYSPHYPVGGIWLSP